MDVLEGLAGERRTTSANSSPANRRNATQRAATTPSKRDERKRPRRAVAAERHQAGRAASRPCGRASRPPWRRTSTLPVSSAEQRFVLRVTSPSPSVQRGVPERDDGHDESRSRRRCQSRMATFARIQSLRRYAWGSIIFSVPPVASPARAVAPSTSRKTSAPTDRCRGRGRRRVQPVSPGTASWDGREHRDEGGGQEPDAEEAGAGASCSPRRAPGVRREPAKRSASSRASSRIHGEAHGTSLAGCGRSPGSRPRASRWNRPPRPAGESPDARRREAPTSRGGATRCLSQGDPRLRPGRAPCREGGRGRGEHHGKATIAAAAHPAGGEPDEHQPHPITPSVFSRKYFSRLARIGRIARAGERRRRAGPAAGGEHAARRPRRASTSSSSRRTETSGRCSARSDLGAGVVGGLDRGSRHGRGEQAVEAALGDHLGPGAGSRRRRRAAARPRGGGSR